MRAPITALIILATAASAQAGMVTSFYEDFNSYGDGSFSSGTPITDGAFFGNNWGIAGKAFWTYDLQGDGGVYFQESNPVQNGMSSTVVLAPGEYNVSITLINQTSLLRWVRLVVGDLDIPVPLGGAGITEQTFLYTATVGPDGSRVSIAGQFPFTFTPVVTEISVTPVPAPGAAGVLAMSGLIAGRRRRMS